MPWAFHVARFKWSGWLFSCSWVNSFVGINHGNRWTAYKINRHTVYLGWQCCSLGQLRVNITNNCRWPLKIDVLAQGLWGIEPNKRHEPSHNYLITSTGITSKSPRRTEPAVIWPVVSGQVEVMRKRPGDSKMAAFSLNEEIQYVKLYKSRPLILHYYLLPFIPIYLTWLYFWIVVFGVSEYYEAGLIVLASVGIVQILCGLFCHWSVHVRSFFTCSAVSGHLLCDNGICWSTRDQHYAHVSRKAISHAYCLSRTFWI